VIFVEDSFFTGAVFALAVALLFLGAIAEADPKNTNGKTKEL